MKSLEFGAWRPVKSLDYNGFYLPFAKFFFLLIRFVMFWNRCLSTRLGCQLQVVSTWSSYNPETINPVWFWLKVTSIEQTGVYHNPERFYCQPMSYNMSYLYSRLELWPSLQSWSANIMPKGHRYYIFPYFVIFTTLVINLGHIYVFGYRDPPGGKPPGRFKLLICRNSLNKWLWIMNLTMAN